MKRNQLITIEKEHEKWQQVNNLIEKTVPFGTVFDWPQDLAVPAFCLFLVIVEGIVEILELVILGKDVEMRMV